MALIVDPAPLLPEPGATKGPRRRTVALVATLVLGAGLIGLLVGRFSQPTTADDIHDALLAKLVHMPGYNKSNPEDERLVVLPYAANCYSFTGGTCATTSCNADRDSECIAGKCSCIGKCTGPDGHCHSSHNHQVASNVILTNVYWTWSKLYMRLFGALFNQMMVSEAPLWTFGGTNEFNIHQLPGTWNGYKMYFLTSSKWTSWTVAMRLTTGTAVSLWGAYALNLYHTIAPWDPQSIIVRICKVPGYSNTIMFGSNSGIWAYIHHASYFVYGWDLSGDPGTGGYWSVNQGIGHMDFEHC